MSGRTRAALAGGLLALAASLLLTACGAESAETVLQRAREKLSQVRSVSYVMTTELELTAAGKATVIKMTGTADYIVEPAAMGMDMVIDMGNLGRVKTRTYMEERGGECLVYSGVDGGDGAFAWTCGAAADSERRQYDAQASMDLLLSSMERFSENGAALINGSSTARYDGVVSGEALDGILLPPGIMDVLGVDASQGVPPLSGLGDMPVSIWVEERSGMPVRYELYMTALMQKMLAGLPGGAPDVSVTSMVAGMTLSNMDGVVSVDIPDEARAAAQQ